MSEPKTLYIIDGHALAYRAYFGMGDGLTTRDGFPTGAILGFLNVMWRMLEQDQPDYLAISFDVGGTFRDEIFPDYKGTRDKMPEDLGEQIDRIQDIIKALNIPIYTLENYEADDVIGSVGMQATREGVHTVVVTGDRDLLQLATDHVRISLPSGRGIGDSKLYGPAEVEEKYGVRPDQFVDYKALVGDSSDNIPGVYGIGEKTAAKLLQAHGSLDGIYAAVDEIKGSVQKKLIEGKDNAYLSQTLSRIVTDLNVNFDIDACAAPKIAQWPPNFDVDAVATLFRDLEFFSLVKRLPSEQTAAVVAEAPGQMALFDMGGEQAAEVAVPAAEPVTETTIVTDKAALNACVAALNAAPMIAFDTETSSLAKMEAELIGISLAVEPGKAWYIPVGHQPDKAPDGQLPIETVLNALRGPLTNPDIPKAAHNAKYDYVMLERYGITVTPMAFDTLLAAWLRYPDSRHLGLKKLASDRLGILMTEIEALIGKGKQQVTFDQVPVAQAAPYAAADADITLRLVPLVTRDLQEAEAETLFTAIEMPLVPVLSRMEMNGISLDGAVLTEMSTKLEAAMAEAEAEIYEVVGYSFNIGSTQQLAQALFNDLGLLPPKGTRRTRGGTYSTAAGVLSEMAEQHEVVRKILEHRELSKLKSTYVDALPTYVNPRTGRIHTTYSQHGSVTGRIASSDPNLQNIPIRTELGREVRRAFVAAPGHKLVAMDYSQIELRIAAHISEDPFLVEAFREGRDIHAATAAAVFNVTLDDVSYEQRRAAKAVNFGLLYGMGRFRLAQSTGITLGEAEEFIDNYFARIPGIKTFIDETIRRAKTDGYVETLLGRRRYFPALQRATANPGDRARAEREAVNSPIQGSAADIIKLAMIELHARLERELPAAKMLLQVHDELVFEVPDDQLDSLVALAQGVMQSAYALRVPLKVDVEVGQNWYNMDDYAAG